MQQRVEELSSDDVALLQKQREWLLGHYASNPSESYSGYAAKLALIETILASGWVKPDETWKLQSLGVALGDALAEHMALRWVAVEDEYGRDPALQDGSTSLKLYPLTVISKRIEAGEDPKVAELFLGLCRKVEEVRLKLRDD